MIYASNASENQNKFGIDWWLHFSDCIIWACGRPGHHAPILMLDHNLLIAPYGGSTIRVRCGGRVLLVRGSSTLGIDIFVNKLFFQNRERMVIFLENGLAVSPYWHHAPTLRSKATHWKLLAGEPPWIAPLVNNDSSSCCRRGGLLYMRCFPALYF